MATLTATTLGAASATGDTSLRVVSATGFAKGKIVQVDGEFFKQTADAVGLVIPVRGGDQGTYCQAHGIGSAVFVGDGADYPAGPPGTAITFPAQPCWNVVTYGAAGAIAIPATKQNQFVQLITGTAGAMTLANPTSANEGIELILMAKDAQAYTITNPGGFLGTTTSSDVATFNGAIGSTLHIKAVNKLWLVLSGITAGVSIA